MAYICQQWKVEGFAVLSRILIIVVCVAGWLLAVEGADVYLVGAEGLAAKGGSGGLPRGKIQARLRAAEAWEPARDGLLDGIEALPPGEWKLRDIAQCLGFGENAGRAEQMRIAAALVKAGWGKRHREQGNVWRRLNASS